jgi:integrase
MTANNTGKRRKLATLKRKGELLIESGIRIRKIRPDYFMVDYRKGDFIRRKCFTTEDAAKTYCQAVANEVMNRGLDAFKLTDAQRLEAVKAFDLLRGTPASLMEAVKEYIQRHPPTGSETVEECAKRYLADMEREEARPFAVKDKRLKFEMFARDYGAQPMVAIGAVEIGNWIRTKGFKAGTGRAYAGAINSLVNFFNGNKRKRTKPRGKTPTTWTVAQVRAIFHKAAEIEPDCIPALTLMFFCGVRPHETLRCTGEMIDFKARLVRLPAEITKTGDARQVTLPDNAVAWLADRVRKGKLIPGATHAESETALNRMRKNVMTAVGVKVWPKDVARHTYATAHYHLHDNAALTMTELGHFRNPDMFKRHYKGVPMDKGDAVDYFAIRPTTEGGVMRFPVARAG